MTLREACIHNDTLANAALQTIIETLDEIGLSLEVSSEMDAYEVLYDLAGMIEVREVK